MRELVFQTLNALVAQGPASLDPNKGTMQAYAGAQARIAEPHLYDMVFPVIALFLVIIIPAAVALWVAWKTITDTSLKDGEA